MGNLFFSDSEFLGGLYRLCKGCTKAPLPVCIGHTSGASVEFFVKLSETGQRDLNRSQKMQRFPAKRALTGCSSPCLRQEVPKKPK
jgi:hypothetical protein